MATASATLSLVLLATAGVFGAIGYWQSQWAGVAAAALAGALCWVGGMSALVIGWLTGNGTPAAVHGVLIGMFFRMGLPLLAGLALHRKGGWLAEAGVLGMIVGFYLVALTVETGIAVWMTKSTG